MSEKEKAIEKLGEMATILGRMQKELKSALKVLINGAHVGTTPAPYPDSVSKPTVTGKPDRIEEIRMALPEELEGLLSFEDKGDYIRVKPRQFLASENFAKIASAIRAFNGEYVSAGKDSHFKVPK